MYSCETCHSQSSIEFRAGDDFEITNDEVARGRDASHHNDAHHRACWHDWVDCFIELCGITDSATIQNTEKFETPKKHETWAVAMKWRDHQREMIGNGQRKRTPTHHGSHLSDVAGPIAT